jgi:hypothetical protein
MLQIILIIAIVVVISFLIYDICKTRNESFNKGNNEKVYIVNKETKQRELNPIIIQKIMNDDYYVSGMANANNVGIRARMYDHFKPDRLDMKNVKKDMK